MRCCWKTRGITSVTSNSSPATARAASQIRQFESDLERLSGRLENTAALKSELPQSLTEEFDYARAIADQITVLTQPAQTDRGRAAAVLALVGLVAGPSGIANIADLKARANRVINVLLESTRKNLQATAVCVLPTADEVIDDANPVALAQQHIDHVAADEAGAPSHHPDFLRTAHFTPSAFMVCTL